MSLRNEPAFREQGGLPGPEINPASRAHCNPANPHATEPAEPARPPRVCWPRPTAAAISRRGGQGAPQRPSGALHPIRQPPAASPRSPQSAGPFPPAAALAPAPPPARRPRKPCTRAAGSFGRCGARAHICILCNALHAAQKCHCSRPRATEGAFGMRYTQHRNVTVFRLLLVPASFRCPARVCNVCNA